MISMDTEKMELIVEFKNAGRDLAAQGRPARPHARLPEPAVGKAVPNGIYDLRANPGWVNVGTDHDTAAFAVMSIRGWWKGAGVGTYPWRLLITANVGGSNRCRTGAWKAELAALARKWSWRSPGAASLLAPLNGTRWSTGCSSTSQPSGPATDTYSPTPSKCGSRRSAALVGPG